MRKRRCSWVTEDPRYIKYHDDEWGKPVYNDRLLFEMLSLEGAQAGLSWLTILKRRENYLKVFDQFDPEKVSMYDEKKIKQLMENEGIIRNELKIRSVINNAQAFLKIRDKFGSFSNYLWQFVDGKPILNNWKSYKEVPSSTIESVQLSKDLKKRGFKFVGPIICYAFMQAVGLVNDHTKDCFLYHGNRSLKDNL